MQGARDQQLAGSIWLHHTTVMAESQILGWVALQEESDERLIFNNIGTAAQNKL